MKLAYLGIKGLPSKGGGERVVEAMARRLADQHQLTVYCDGRYTLRGAIMPGVNLIHVPTLRGKHLQAVTLFIFSALHALLRGNYDLVHVHNTEACFVVPLLRVKYRVVATSHGQAQAREKWGTLAKKLLHLVELFYVWFPHVLTSVSAPLATEYQRRYGRLVHYLPNGVDNSISLDLEAAASTLCASGVGKNYVLFAAGRLDPTKGCHLLLQAFRGMEADIQLVVVADTATLPDYSRELQETSDGRVKFIPFIESKSELFGIVRGARFFVFPSTVEAMSMMLLEVASLGVPVVCSDIPANTSVLFEHALYFISGNVDDLRRRLQWALEHGEEMNELACSAKAWVQQCYSWDVIAEEYDRLYQRVLA